MASAPSFSLATPSALALSDGEDDDEEATPRDGGGGSGALQDLSTTPSSDSGSGSLEARRTPPRVLKRSLRTELLERWPGWRSPARKRLRAASPDLQDVQDPVTAAALSSALGWPTTSSSTPPTGACDRFWKLVEKIASQPSLLDRAEDCERLCVEEAAADCETAASTPPAGPRHSPRFSPRTTSPSPPQSPPPSPAPSPGQSPARSPHRSADSGRSSPAARRKPGDTSARALTAPLSTWVGDDPTLLQTVVLAVPDDQDDDDDSGPPPAALLSPGQDGPATPPPAAAVDAILLADGHDDALKARRPARELLERLQLLEGQPLGQPAAAEQDKPDVEEDSSVLQLLVLTPTEERKFGEAPRRACLQTAAATSSRCKAALGVLLRLRVPFFIIALGIVQVTLYAGPSQYVAQEMKNRFVWDKARLFKEPWRAMSYAMLHSGQMHVGLNVGVQSFVGAPLEREQSALRVAAVFFGGAVYGALVTGVVSPTLHMVGASAGIYAILMSHLAQILLNSDAVRYPRTRAGAVLLLTGADMAYTAHHAIQRGNAAPRIGVTAHCAGALSGVFLGLAFYRATPASLAGLARTHPSYLSYFCYCCHRRCALLSLQVCSGITMAAGVLFCLVWIYFDKPGEGLGLSF